MASERQAVSEPIQGLHALMQWFPGVYPTRLDKSPACRDPKKELSNDPAQILRWLENKNTKGFAVRIPNGTRVVVVDIDSPTKHIGAHDGYASFLNFLEEHGIALPDHLCTVQTPSGGWHLYFLLPEGFTLFSKIGVLKGVDLLSVGSNVVLPGSQAERGEYRLVQGDFENIPTMPLEMALAFRTIAREAAKERKAKTPMPHGLYSPNEKWEGISPRKRYLLFKNKYFRTMWRMEKREGDISMSAYEYHLAKACFCVGMDAEQALIVIGWWWKRHNLTGRNEKTLRKYTLPKAWAEVEDYISNYKSLTQPLRITTSGTPARRVSGGRKQSETTLRVLVLFDSRPFRGPRGLASISGASLGAVYNILRRYRPNWSNTCHLSKNRGTLAYIAELLSNVKTTAKKARRSKIVADITTVGGSNAHVAAQPTWLKRRKYGIRGTPRARPLIGGTFRHQNPLIARPDRSSMRRLRWMTGKKAGVLKGPSRRS